VLEQIGEEEYRSNTQPKTSEIYVKNSNR